MIELDLAYLWVFDRARIAVKARDRGGNIESLVRIEGKATVVVVLMRDLVYLVV